MAEDQPINVDSLYREFGRFNNVATFVFKAGSAALEAYGPYVTGCIRYRPSDRIALHKALEERSQAELPQVVKLGFVFPDDDRAKSLRLKREGFTCDDIAECHFIPWHSKDGFVNKELRELPNVIKIKVDTSQFLPGAEDNITLHRYESTLQAGWEFIDEEKFDFVGRFAALCGGDFPKEYLDKLSLNEEDVRNEDRVWLYLYETKAKRSNLSNQEQSHLYDIKANRTQERLAILASELKEAFGDLRKAGMEPEKLKIILDAISTFREERVLYVSCPIYWDFRTYAHIYLRHVKETQLAATSKEKRSFHTEKRM